MPILDVQLVGEVSGTVRQNLARRIAQSAAEVLDSRPGRTWVKVAVIPATDYAESGGGPLQHTRPRPVFVSVLKRSVPQGEELAREVAALTRAIARATGRPADSVHIIYQPPGVGRVAFGGTPIR